VWPPFISGVKGEHFTLLRLRAGHRLYVCVAVSDAFVSFRLSINFPLDLECGSKRSEPPLCIRDGRNPKENSKGAIVGASEFLASTFNKLSSAACQAGKITGPLWTNCRKVAVSIFCNASLIKLLRNHHFLQSVCLLILVWASAIIYHFPGVG